MIIFGYKFERAHFERSHTPRPTKIQKSERAKEGRARAVLRGTFANRLLRVEFVLSPARGFLSSRERFFFRFRVNARRWSFSKRVRLLEFIMTHKKCFFGIFGAMCWTFRKIRENFCLLPRETVEIFAEIFV